jgi:hypothetical protein
MGILWGEPCPGRYNTFCFFTLYEVEISELLIGLKYTIPVLRKA